MRRDILVFWAVLTFLVGQVLCSYSMNASNVRSGPEDLQVDPYSGSAGFAYPINVPQGRGGVVPNLALTYNSNNKNGALGMGWSLELGAIHISTQNGIPKLDGISDAYILIQNGSSQELVFDSSPGTDHLRKQTHS